MSRDKRDFAARWRAIGVSLLLGLALSACARGRSVVDVQPPMSHAGAGSGLARIGEIRDLRKFEAAPRDPSTPSLGDAGDVYDPAIAARAIARKRGAYGRAFGDVVLPEGSTVVGLVRGAATKALQDAGYTVVDEKSPDYAAALPLAIDIEQFWAWFTPGAFLVTIEFDGRIALKGDALVGGESVPVRGRAAYDAGAVFESDWANIVAEGLGNLSEKMRERIRAPAVAAAAQTRISSNPPSIPAARPVPAEVKLAPPPATPAAATTSVPLAAASLPPAVASPVPAPAMEFRRTGVLANDMDGRWIGYGDYTVYRSPTPEQQQALLARCAKSYSTFKVEGAKLIVDTHQDSDVHRQVHSISRQRRGSLVYGADNGRGVRFTTVTFDKDRDLGKFGLPTDVLVFDLRSPAPIQSLGASSTLKYARCPTPQAAVENEPMAPPADSRAASIPDARVAQADNSSSVVAMAVPTRAPASRAGGLINDIEGRWISYADYAITASPTQEQRQALLSRCSKSYSTFSVSGSQLVVESHSDTDVRRSEYSISRRRPDSLLLASDNRVRDSAGLTNVSFAKDRVLNKFGFSPDVLVFELRSPQGGSYNPFATPRNYARCPTPDAAAQ